MIIIKHNIKPKQEFINITEIVQKDIEKYAINNGLAIIYSKHTTACIRVIEPETLLKTDMSRFLEKLASKNDFYAHDDIFNRDVPPEERRNGYSHLRAMVLNHQEIIPIIDKKLDLGKWQAIYYIECDLGKEDRTFNVLLISERLTIYDS